MKGILLAGGHGTRLRPMTTTISKQILPVYDKPMIYYPLSTLMLAGIRDILIISTPQDLPSIQGLLKDGSHLGLTIHYAEQSAPRGIAEALIIGESFIGNDTVCLILGDNIFYGHGLRQILSKAVALQKGAHIFAYHVTDPERYGVVYFDAMARPEKIVEKPKKPESNWAVTGIYFYDAQAVAIAKSLKPSARGELEITDVNTEYLRRKTMTVELLNRGMAWLDTGTPDALLEASQYIQMVEKRQGLKIACIEEIAFFMRFIDQTQLLELSESYKGSAYGAYLESVLKHGATSEG